MTEIEAGKVPVEQCDRESEHVIGGPWLTESDDERFWEAEIQATGGHSYVAKIYADSEDVAREMAERAIAAWARCTPPTDEALAAALKENKRFKTLADDHFRNTQELAQRLASIRAQALGEAWQPMDTAPKDKYIILCGYLDGPHDPRIKMGYWFSEEQRWSIDGASWRPVLWQPAPSPPRNLKGEKA